MGKMQPANTACFWKLQLRVESPIPGKEYFKAPNTKEQFQSFMYIQETFMENLIFTKYCTMHWKKYQEQYYHGPYSPGVTVEQGI